MDKILLFLIAIVFLAACQEQPPKAILDNAPEAELIVPEKIMSDEERALQNKIAARALLQKVIDGNTELQKEELYYECSHNTGGLLTILRKGDNLQSIRFAYSQEQASEFVRYYYRNNQLQLISHEKGIWLGEDEKMTQTLFYLENEMIFHCLMKEVEGNSSTIENIIQRTDYTEMVPNQQLLDKLQKDKQLLEQKDLDAIKVLYCQ